MSDRDRYLSHDAGRAKTLHFGEALGIFQLRIPMHHRRHRRLILLYRLLLCRQ